MTRALVHRGPDGEGFWHEGDAALGHRRLSIIDIAGGQQPISNEDGTVQVVFNGEIYNYRELKGNLEAKGHRFRTHCDAEVLPHLYEEYGMEMWHLLSGMFAVAIYDTRKRMLWLARDPFGIKPLFVAETSERLLFASEIKALLASTWLDSEVDSLALLQTLLFLFPIPPRTGWRTVREVLPGTWEGYGLIGYKAGRFRPVARYQQTFGGSEEMLCALNERMRSAIESHLISDVPVGALLSGGIDSAVVCSYLTSRVPPVAVFTATFDDDRANEAPRARRTAGLLGLELEELPVSGRAVTGELVERVLRQYDQPFADSSAIPTYLLCERIRKHVKVALGGDGGDEMFAGYPIFRHLMTMQRLGQQLAPIGSLVRGLAPCFGRRGRKVASMWGLPREEMYLQLRCYFKPDELAEVWEGGRIQVEEAIHEYFSIQNGAHSDSTSVPSQRDDCQWLTDLMVQRDLFADMLKKVDVASSAHGLEIRVPYLDHGLALFALSLPTGDKLHKGRPKWPLRALLRARMGKAFTHVRKHGFEIPLHRLGQDYKELLRDSLRSSKCLHDALPSQFTEQVVADFMQTHSSSHSRYVRNQRAHALLSLALFLERK